jgi:hypothetical protein
MILCTSIYVAMVGVVAQMCNSRACAGKIMRSSPAGVTKQNTAQKRKSSSRKICFPYFCTHFY